MDEFVTNEGQPLNLVVDAPATSPTMPAWRSSPRCRTKYGNVGRGPATYAAHFEREAADH